MALASSRCFHHSLWPSSICRIHDEIWAEHDRHMKRHFELIDQMWDRIDKEFFADFPHFPHHHHHHHFHQSRHHESFHKNREKSGDNQVAVREKLDVFPKVNAENNEVSMRMQLPEHVDQSKLSVSNKDGDLVVKLDDKTETPEGGCRAVSYFSQTTMPSKTDFAGLKWILDDKSNVLSVTAPLKKD